MREVQLKEVSKIGVEEGGIGERPKRVATEVENHDARGNVGWYGRQIATTAVGGLESVTPRTATCRGTGGGGGWAEKGGRK